MVETQGLFSTHLKPRQRLAGNVGIVPHSLIRQAQGVHSKGG